MPDRVTLRRPGSGRWRTARPLPGSLRALVESEMYGASCDWGSCDRPIDGLAHNGDEQWLAICHGCARGHPQDPTPQPVIAFFSLLGIEHALHEPADPGQDGPGEVIELADMRPPT